jgi:NADP-reducing hydrogenase subunit HndB
MPITTIDDLKRIKEKTLSANALRPGAVSVKITVHAGTCGLAAGAGDVLNALKREMAECGRTDIRVLESGCMGMCSSEPNVTVEVLGSDPVVYEHMNAKRMRQVFRRHVLQGEVQSDFAQGRI